MNTPDDRAGASWLRYTHLGLQYCLTLLLFVLGGRWMDQRLDMDPTWTIVGALVGFGASTYLIVRQALQIKD